MDADSTSTKGGWLMNVEICNAVRASDKETQYDASAKRLLGHKNILAHILVKTIDEFKGMNPKEVLKNIEGTPYISSISIEPGLTNISNEQAGKRLVGMNSENEEINEGLIRFDIVFYVSRLISSQKERDFENTNYNDIKKVYSIWVCMNMSENSMSHIHLTQENIIGRYKWKGKLDLINIVMIGLGTVLPDYDKTYELHRLLGALLSDKLSSDEKLDIMEKEYDIPIEEDLRKDVSEMCNLSQGIKEQGIAIGQARGEQIGQARGEGLLIKKMHKNGLTIQQIAQATEKDIEEIERIIEQDDANVYIEVVNNL